jgi:hypothetical protein
MKKVSLKLKKSVLSDEIKITLKKHYHARKEELLLLSIRFALTYAFGDAKRIKETQDLVDIAKAKYNALQKELRKFGMVG